MGSKKAAPTTGTSRRSATTRCFCSPITVTAWRRSCAPSNVSSADDWEELLVPEIDRLQAAGTCASRSGPTPPSRGRRSTKRWRRAASSTRSGYRQTRTWSWRSKTSCFGHRDGPASKTAHSGPELPVPGGQLDHAPAGRGKSRAPRRRAVPARRLRRDESPDPQSRRRAVLQQARHRRAMDQGRQAGSRTGRGCRAIDFERTRSGCS